MTSPVASGGKLRPGRADGNTGPAQDKSLNVKRTKNEARRGESERRAEKVTEGTYQATSGTHSTDIIVAGVGRLDFAAKELTDAQEPESGKPGTNMAAPCHYPLGPLLLPGDTTNCSRTSSIRGLES